MLSACLGQESVSCLVDTGAAVSIILHSLVSQTAAESFSPEREPRLRSLMGEPLEVLGEVSLTVTIGTWTICHPFVVVQFDTCPILGSDLL